MHEIGNLVKEEIINLNIINNKINEFKNIKVLVLGGSQAAKAFADLLPEIFKKIKNSGNSIKIYQQCLKNQRNQLINYYKKNEINHEIFTFSDQINDFYSRANLVITRAGASVLRRINKCKNSFYINTFTLISR